MELILNKEIRIVSILILSWWLAVNCKKNQKPGNILLKHLILFHCMEEHLCIFIVILFLHYFFQKMLRYLSFTASANVICACSLLFPWESTAVWNQSGHFIHFNWFLPHIFWFLVHANVQFPLSPGATKSIPFTSNLWERVNDLISSCHKGEAFQRMLCHFIHFLRQSMLTF